MKEINHYGVCATDVMINGQFVPTGTILRVSRMVPDEEAVDWLKNDKKLIHDALDHHGDFVNCRKEVCEEIQREIDGLALHESRVTDHQSRG